MPDPGDSETVAPLLTVPFHSLSLSLLATSCDMWDVSSPTRGRTHVACGSAEETWS